MDALLNLDLQLFHWINAELYHDGVASVMAVIRNRYLWVPCYVTLIAWIVLSFTTRDAYYIVIYLILGVLLTDFAAGQLLKKHIKRIRPCMEERILQPVNVKAPCRHSYSFPSAHAANHFGLATLILGLLPLGKKRIWRYILFGWALLISVAQIYVGLHFPLDIIGGAILGVTMMRGYLRIISRWAPKIYSTDLEFGNLW